MLEALDFGLKKKRDYSICVAKTKVQISFTVTAKLRSAPLFSHMQIVPAPIVSTESLQKRAASVQLEENGSLFKITRVEKGLIWLQSVSFSLQIGH